MIRGTLVTAAALALAFSAIASASPEFRWLVLDADPAIVQMVRDPVVGPMTARRVVVLFVAAKPNSRGYDNQVNWRTVDCVAHTIVETATVERAGLRNAPVSPEPDPKTPTSYEDPEGRQIYGDVADYACTGKRRSHDATVIRGNAAAIAYARKVAANTPRMMPVPMPVPQTEMPSIHN